MSEIILECQGLPCPQPVLMCKRTVEEENPPFLTVVVDNEAARQNVSRFLAMHDYAVTDEPRGGAVFKIIARKNVAAGEACSIMTEEEMAALGGRYAQTRIMVFITSEFFGSGDDVLGGKLMANFLTTLPEMGPDLWRVVMVNGGVKLAVQGSPVLEKLQALETAGVEIFACGACLEHFGLIERRAVGQTTNMLDIVTGMQLAAKVIRV